MHKVFGLIKAVLWFLKRPRFYPELILALKEYVRKRIVSRGASAEAVEWCEARAITTCQALDRLLGTRPPENFHEKFADVFSQAAKAAQNCPVKMGGPGNLDLLHAIAEYAGAEKVIETGVAYGWSSLALLLSLSNRQDTILVSTDMPYIDRNNVEYIGMVVPEEIRAGWEVIIGPDRISLPQALKKLPVIDLCHYDSDKSYRGRMWAYGLLWKALKPGGYFISDDIGDNFAFRDFCDQTPKEAIVVGSQTEAGTKYVGILIKETNESSE
jgi:predicted O-methyltransferase YrrM